MNKREEALKSVSTSNLLEVSYLLERSHRITDVESKAGTYGVPELFITLEGLMIDLDHKSFLTAGTAGGTTGGTAALNCLQEAMDAISDVMSEGLVIP